jgi:hypothetical protein
MIKNTGPGKGQQLLFPDRLLLFNFNIDGHELKPEHQSFLQTTVVPTLQSGGSISIVGLASRSGRFMHNQHLSVHRAESVRTFLQRTVPNGFAVREFKGFGERKAKFDHLPDGSENERYRSVVLFLSSGPLPPVPQLNDSSMREVPVPKNRDTEGPLDTIGKILDVTGGVGSIVNLALDALLIDVIGVFISGIAAILGLPAVWLESNNFAKQNGQKLGFSKCMQEMADAFANEDLRSAPESTWPRVPHPVPQFSGSDQDVTVADRSAREGMRNGYEAAWKVITRMDQAPRTMSATLRGKPVQVLLSGRRFLWLLRRSYHEDVWRQILRKLG